jgi:hypothetical protein
MCYVLYLGTDADLPTEEWDEHTSTFYIHEIAEETDAARQHFTKSRVYSVGAHTGCGCGFFFHRSDGPTERAAAMWSSWRLVDTTEMILSSDTSAELLISWSGLESDPPARRLSMTRDMLLPGEALPFELGGFIVLSRRTESNESPHQTEPIRP